jgi:hypothetical protein
MTRQPFKTPATYHIRFESARQLQRPALRLVRVKLIWAGGGTPHSAGRRIGGTSGGSCRDASN